MIKLLLASLLLSVPITDRLIPTQDGLSAHQCETPMFVVFDPRLSANMTNLAKEAMSYWNDILGYEFFVDAGKVGGKLPPQGFLIVRPSLETDDFDHQACAVTTFMTEVGSGCMGFVQLVVMPLCQPMGNGLMLSVLRHEFGHVLGLSHNQQTPVDLMQPFIPKKGHPLHATPDDVGVVRELYRN